MTTRFVRIEYVIRDDVNLDEVEKAIAEFVAGIRAHHPEHRYTSYRHAKEPRHFIQIGELVESAAASLQTEPFFPRFTAFLRERCATGPEVTALTRVATAR